MGLSSGIEDLFEGLSTGKKGTPSARIKKLIELGYITEEYYKGCKEEEMTDQDILKSLKSEHSTKKISNLSEETKVEIEKALRVGEYTQKNRRGKNCMIKINISHEKSTQR